VRGIGEKKFLQLEDGITVGEPASKTRPKTKTGKTSG